MKGLNYRPVCVSLFINTTFRMTPGKKIKVMEHE